MIKNIYLLGANGVVGQAVASWLRSKQCEFEPIGRKDFNSFLDSVSDYSYVINCSTMPINQIATMLARLSKLNSTKVLHCSSSAIGRGDMYAKMKYNEEVLFRSCNAVNSKFFRLGVPYYYENGRPRFIGYWDSLNLKPFFGKIRVLKLSGAQITDLEIFFEWIGIELNINAESLYSSHAPLVPKFYSVQSTFLQRYLPVRRLNILLGKTLGVGIVF